MRNAAKIKKLKIRKRRSADPRTKVRKRGKKYSRKKKKKQLQDLLKEVL